MALDIALLVAPLSDDQPAGPDLYGDANRQQIELAFERSVSDGAASQNSAAEWQETIALIVAQAEVTRDLWLPVYLMRAAAQAGQFELVVDGAVLLAALLEDRWADVHPQLDDLGFIGRKTPCESLVRIGDFLGAFERMPLVSHARLGAFSGADFERFREKGAKAAGFGEFRMAIEAIGADGLAEAIAGLGEIEQAIRRVDAALTANADGDTATNFKPTYDVLARMKRAIAVCVPQKSGDSKVGGASGNDTATSRSEAMSSDSSSGNGANYSGAINSRNDVISAMDAICAYYAQYEPGSPVPFVLRRAREWISLDFMAVLADIAPGSLEEAMKVLKGQGGEVAETADWGDNGSAITQEDESPESEGDGSW